jgi:hypothetical protein
MTARLSSWCASAVQLREMFLCTADGMAEYKAGPRKRKPTHPGQVLKTQLEALGLTAYAADSLLGVSQATLG